MKKVLLALSVLFMAQKVRAQSKVVLPDSMTTANSIRPADLLANDIRWNRASTDFFTYWVDNGLYGFYGPQPEVMVDGLPIDANFFGWQNLNMLPITNSSKVAYGLNPQIYHNVVSPAGYVDYQSATVKPGITVNASFYAGNETGDPGPYNYDSLKVTPNIDRWGPDDAVSIAYRKNNWYTKGSLLFRNHHPTDLAMNSRLHFTASLLGTNAGYVNHTIYDSTRSAMLETGYLGDKLQIKARAVYGLNKDYVFLQPFGREIPAKTGYRQLAVQGNYQMGDWTFTGRYIGHQKSIDKRIALHSYIFDWTQRKHTVGFSTHYQTNEISIEPGITLERRNTDAPGLRTGSDDDATFFLNTSLPTSDNDSLGARLSADYNNKRVAKTIDLRFPHTFSKHWHLTPSFTYSEVLPVRQNAFSYWINRGYTFADSLDIPYTGEIAIKKNKTTIYKMRSLIQLSPGLSFTFVPSYIKHQSLNVPFQKVDAYEYHTDTKPGPFSVTQEKGGRFNLYAEVKQTFESLLVQSLSFNIQQTTSGSQRYKSYFDQIPNTKIQYSADVFPAPDIILSLNALYRSSTIWNEFQAIDGNHYHLPNGIPIREYTGTFHTKTPGYADISLGIQKWFLKRRIHAQFSVKNLLNKEIRMHPLGANLATKFEIKVGIKL